jgi:ParB-like chromosome segregation protein Spo0J
MVMDDREAVIQMNLENRGRSDLSAYEQALSMRKQIREGLFVNHEELADSLKLARNTISERLALAKLPKDIVALFQDPREITVRTGLLLTRMTPETEAALESVRALVQARGPQSGKTIVAMLKSTKSEKVTLRDTAGGLVLKAVVGDEDTKIVIPRTLTRDEIEKIRAVLETTQAGGGP